MVKVKSTCFDKSISFEHGAQVNRNDEAAYELFGENVAEAFVVQGENVLQIVQMVDVLVNEVNESRFSRMAAEERKEKQLSVRLSADLEISCLQCKAQLSLLDSVLDTNVQI